MQPHRALFFYFQQLVYLFIYKQLIKFKNIILYRKIVYCLILIKVWMDILDHSDSLNVSTRTHTHTQFRQTTL